MKQIFADTFYFLALMSDTDEAHAQASDFAAGLGTRLVTTAWVLTELADGLAQTGHRESFAGILNDLESDPGVDVLPPDDALWRRGIALYNARSDKGWSLTDCISFVVMKDYDIAEALTGDHHFQQAGFLALLRSDD